MTPYRTASPRPQGTHPPIRGREDAEARRVGAGEWSLAAFVALGLVLALMV